MKRTIAAAALAVALPALTAVAVVQAAPASATMAPAAVFTTSGRCRDINIRATDKWVLACVVFIDHTDECNRWTRLPTGKWTVVASDVRDGTRFELRIRYWEWPERTGLVAF
jgi:hypothetical protein